MKFNVTEIEFDLNDSLSEEYQLTFDDEIALRDDSLGVWEADDEDDLIEEITTACLLYTSPSPRDIPLSRMPSSA